MRKILLPYYRTGMILVWDCGTITVQVLYRKYYCTQYGRATELIERLYTCTVGLVCVLVQLLLGLTVLVRYEYN